MNETKSMFAVGWLAAGLALACIILTLLFTGCVSSGVGGAGLFMGSTTNAYGGYSIGVYDKNTNATNVYKISLPINPAAILQTFVAGGGF
jgi:hypothetical protein